ncbi:cyclic nucleotide-binding domain-containing protein [Marinicella gelatinilytica]|uniref:cyclic nucleotide-binding domain-containing protein n=1 Tax=Marinicella gelatinilytica TaxID=2996017 RepID=UPI002260CD3E|nr:cyclic nucleotide-binding domain-containing protein [Marinicella gelatinilytica]MCX7545229.1 cyclic nucleotide-binding domain-containing protein [Marinicella gelatinilytica]
MISAEQLQNYFPFNTINPDFYPLLLSQCQSFEAPKDTMLSKHGQPLKQSLFLTQGVVQVTTESGREKVLKSKSLSAKYPIIDAHKSQDATIRATSQSVSGFGIDAKLLEQFQVWNRCHTEAPLDSPLRNHQSYQWVLGLLNSRTVKMIPQGNVSELFAVLERIEVRQGDELMSEGEAGDFCYIVADGKAGVFKCQADGEIQAATLKSGDLFGESALVSNEPRDAGVRMMSDGVLMRLSGEAFRKLLKAHVVRWITAEKALQKIANGATLLDVRENDEHQQMGIKGSLNIPLPELRERSRQINPNAPIITASNMGSRCAAAAYTLTTMDFDVYALQGGISGLLRHIERA